LTGFYDAGEFRTLIEEASVMLLDEIGDAFPVEDKMRSIASLCSHQAVSQ